MASSSSSSSASSSCASSSSSKAEAKRKSSFGRRQLTLMKKAEELSTLCGVEVAVICYGPYGEIQTWPRDTSKVRDVAEKYKKLSKSDRRKKSVNLSEFLEKIKTEDEKNKKIKKTKKKGFQLKADKLDGYTAEELSGLLDFLDRKSKTLQERLRFLDSQKQRSAGPSEAEHGQSSDFPRTQETYKPKVLSNSAETCHSLVPFEQQATESVHLHENTLFSSHMMNESLAPFHNISYGSVPCYYSNYAPDFGQSPTPLMSFQNFLASCPNGDWSSNPGFLQASNMSMDMGDKPAFLVPQAYESNGFQNVSGFTNLMMNNNTNNVGLLQPQFPQIQTPTPLQQFGPFLGMQSRF